MTTRELFWEVTRGCNLRCRYCLVDAADPLPDELTPEEAADVVLWWKAAAGTGICFTGGEPFVYPDFISLLSLTRLHGLRPAVVTNATSLTPDICSVLRELDVRVGVSLDAVQSRFQDSLRGPGTTERVLRALSVLREHEVNVDVHVTVSVRPWRFGLGVMSLAERFGCASVRFSDVISFGRARETVLRLDGKQPPEPLHEEIGRLAERVFGEGLVECQPGCWVDGSDMYLSARGDLYPCTEIVLRAPTATLGNVRRLKGRPPDVVRRTGAGGACCYRVFASRHVTCMESVSFPCSLFGGSGHE